MGASESKLVFKKGIFRLSEEARIPPDDPYWLGFWELPESVEDVFSLFSSSDIRRTRDASLENLETLILAVTSRLNALRNDPAFPNIDAAPEREALNCIRVLTRLLPYVYEADNLAEWEETFFWGVRRRKVNKSHLQSEVLFDDSQTNDKNVPVQEEDVYEDIKPLAEELLDTLIDLLFTIGFTLPRLPNAKDKVTYAIWQSGVGCKQSLSTNKDLESNRCEVLRLLLTMMSKSMYMSSAVLPVKGVRTITYLAACDDKQIVLSVLCSLLNTTIKHNPTSWRIPYDHVVWKDSRQCLVVYSLQMLLVLLLYTIPGDEQGPAPKNYYRHFLARVHRPEDFTFIADGMTRILSQPMQATSYLPGTQKQSRWAPEMIMLFWEVLQCNKRFRSFIIDSNRMHDFVVMMLFYAVEHKTDMMWQGIVRMCVFVLQTMSVEPTFGKNLNKKFEAQETLPASIRLANFRGSYADFLIITVHGLITTSKGRLDTIYPALLAIISNMAPHTQRISITSCAKLMQLFATMSSPSFLLANESNHSLLQSLLEAINAMIEHQYTTNANLVYAILKSRKRIDALRTFTLEGAQQEIERASKRRKEGVANMDLESLTQSSRPINEDPMSPLARSNTDRSSEGGAEDSTFAIGGDDDSDEDESHPTPSQSSPSARNSRAPSIASSSAEDAVPTQLRGMSEKARGKMPAGASNFSRQSSTTSLSHRASTFNGGWMPSPEWIETWLPELPLHTFLTLIRVLAPRLPSPSITTSSNDGEHTPTASTPDAFISTLPESKDHPAIASILSTPSLVKIHMFEWSTLSLGWYTSVLWSLIFTAEMHIAPAASTTASTISNTVTGNASTGIGPIGIWNGTQVKLFQVSTEGKREGPSLSAPRGAVDAVGTRLVDGVRGLSIGGLVGRFSISGSSGASPTLGNGDSVARGSMREV